MKKILKRNYKFITLNFNNKITRNVFIAFVVVVVLFVALNIANGLFYPKSSYQAFSYNKSNTTVIIDAGHGGEDGGAISQNDILEKDINLRIALKLKDFLILNGFNVIMIREDDISIYDEKNKTLHQKKVSDINNRIKIANENIDAIYISIHQNKFAQQSVKGSQVFYTKNNEQSKKLAKIMQDNFKNQLNQEGNRAIKEANKDIMIMKQIKNIAVLIECGFLSNQEEERLLRDETYQSKIAFIIMNSLYDFLLQQKNN